MCKYGKEAPECAVFLYKLAPTKVNKYHPDFKPEQIELMKVEKETVKEEEQATVASNKAKSTLKEKYIVIEVKNRGKKNFITTVSGLNNFSKFLFIETLMRRK